MTHQEKRAWIMLVVSAAAYAVYAAVNLTRAGWHSLARVPYAATLLWTVGAATAASVLAETALGIVSRGESRLKDERDRRIGALGDHVGSSFVVIGAVAGMLMAMAGWDRFWIANVIYLCFVLSAVLSGITKVIAYRTSFPW